MTSSEVASQVNGARDWIEEACYLGADPDDLVGIVRYWAQGAHEAYLDDEGRDAPVHRLDLVEFL